MLGAFRTNRNLGCHEKRTGFGPHYVPKCVEFSEDSWGMSGVLRLESELSTIKDSRHNINVALLNWKIIPADQNLSSAVKSSYLNSIVKRGETVNIDRLYRIIETFKPIQCFIGKNEFDGYLVFLLERSSKVICDNPIVGNAVYILDGDWKNLSQQSKAELLDHHRDNVARVIHTGDWIWRIRQAIYH